MRTVAVIVIVADAPAAKLAIVPVVVPLLLVNVPLALVAETKVSWLVGNVSTTDTLLAGEGPSLVTTIMYVNVWPI